MNEHSNSELKQIIDSYRHTLIFLSVVIVATFALFAWVLLVEMPSIVSTAVKDIVHTEVRAAFDETVDHVEIIE